MYIFIYVSQIKTANNINTVDDLVFFFWKSRDAVE